MRVCPWRTKNDGLTHTTYTRTETKLKYHQVELYLAPEQPLCRLSLAKMRRHVATHGGTFFSVSYFPLLVALSFLRRPLLCGGQLALSQQPDVRFPLERYRAVRIVGDR